MQGRCSLADPWKCLRLTLLKIWLPLPHPQCCFDPREELVVAAVSAARGEGGAGGLAFFDRRRLELVRRVGTQGSAVAVQASGSLFLPLISSKASLGYQLLREQAILTGKVVGFHLFFFVARQGGYAGGGAGQGSGGDARGRQGIRPCSALHCVAGAEGLATACQLLPPL